MMFFVKERERGTGPDFFSFVEEGASAARGQRVRNKI